MSDSRKRIARTWVREGGPTKYAGLMSRIAKRESGGNRKANNAGLNSNGTVDHGWYQVNDVWRKDPVIGKLFDNGGIYTRRGNTQAAIRILKVQGPQAWATYNSATDKKYLSGFSMKNLKAGKPHATTTVSPGKLPQTHTDVSGALVDALLNHGKTGLLQAAVKGVESGAYTTTTPGKLPATTKRYGDVPKPATPGKSAPAPSAKGTTSFEGHTVAAWIAPILRYARAHGWTGHVASGFRSYADQKRIYDSGVRPAAVPGTSNHEGADFPRGAIDVDGAAQLSAILLKSKYAKTLVYAGAKDNVHFSHPHNGSY